MDSKSNAQLSRTISQVVIRLRMPTHAHEVDSFNRFQSADQDGVWNVDNIAHHVELVVHAINEIDVGESTELVHRFGAFRASSTVSV